MSTYKLTYFDFRGRGELIRLVMVAANKDFEDLRLPSPEWHRQKAGNLYGTIPLMDMGGKQYFQGSAIARYLAKENGLYGANNLDDLMIDQMVDLKEDILREEAKFIFGSDEIKAEQVKKLPEQVYPRVFKIFTYCIQQNPKKSGFLVGDKVSLGDLAVYEGTQMCFQNHPKILDEYKEIKALRAKVESCPGLKEYLAKRKVTPI